MSRISYVSTAIPDNRVTSDEMEQISKIWLQNKPIALEKFLRINRQAGVSSRNFAIPYSEILSLNGMQNRAQQFEKNGTSLLIKVINDVLVKHDQDPTEIGALIFTSCSVPLIPSIDVKAILETSLPNDVTRVPIYQHGCAGGVVGLSLASKLACLGKPVIMASVELCSLVFQPTNHSGHHLVGAALFGDGAAATLINPKKGHFTIIDSHSHLLPDSTHLMGYDIFDDGFHLRLDRSLPGALIQKAPSIIENFLKRNDIAVQDVDYWLFHPGGIKILNFLKEAFALSDDQCCWSYRILNDYGNLSSTTILFVINAFLNDVKPMPGQNVLVMGIGPGLTVETILLKG